MADRLTGDVIVRRTLVPLLLGVLLGLFSARGDGVHVMLINGLANAASPWVLVAFTAGALQASWRSAALAGGGALLLAVITYYVGFLAGGASFLLPFLAVWSVAAIVLGALFGVAGATWRADRAGRGATALAIVGGVLLAEAAHRLILLQVWTGIEWDRTYMQVATADTVAAAVLLLVLLDRRRWRVAAAVVPLVAILGVGVLAAGSVVLGLAASAAQ